MKNVNDYKFWENIYLNDDAGWDLGGKTPFFDEFSDKIKIGKVIVLGCGRGYDAVMFAKKGFEVTAVDFSPSAINFLDTLAFQENVSVNTIREDIFSLNKRYKDHFDYLIEQTCFCAIDPIRRSEYELLAQTILKDNGKLVGLWYPLGKMISEGGPPYGVSINEIKSLFKERWEIETEKFSNLSIKKRRNKEKVIILRKKLKVEISSSLI